MSFNNNEIVNSEKEIPDLLFKKHRVLIHIEYFDN